MPHMRHALVALLALSCSTKHDVDIELPHSGRALSKNEKKEIQRVADETFGDARTKLDGLPARLTLIVRWGKDVLPETGENGTASYPGNVMWTLDPDPDRDALATIRTQLRATLFHEHMSFADDFMTRWTGYAADSRRENALPGAPPPGGGAGRGAPPTPPSTPSGKFFMRDLDFMVEEMKIARNDGSFTNM